MGCGASQPVAPDVFLLPHVKESANLLEPADERMLLAFQARQTSSPMANPFRTTPPRQISLMVYKFAHGSTTAVVQNPDATTLLASAPVPPWSRPEPFLRLHGTAASTAKAPELRLELTAADGTPVGLLLTKCKRHVQNVPAQMYVYSVAPRHAGQPTATELAFSERSGRVEFVPTKKPLTLSDGRKVYAWARLHRPHGSASFKLLAFSADAAGHFSKDAEQSYCGRGSALRAVARWSRTDSHDGSGCALMRSERLPPEALGHAPDPKGKPMPALVLEVAAGVDAVLMVAFAVLWEKASENEHFEVPK